MGNSNTKTRYEYDASALQKRYESHTPVQFQSMSYRTVHTCPPQSTSSHMRNINVQSNVNLPPKIHYNRSDLRSEKETHVLSHDLGFNPTINTISKVAVTDEEKYSNGNKNIRSQNNKTVYGGHPPRFNDTVNAINTKVATVFDREKYNENQRIRLQNSEIDISPRFNHTVNTTTKVVTVTDKERYNNDKFDQIGSKSNPIGLKNNEITISPPKILTQNDFMTDWFSWKKTFLSYMESIDPVEINKDKWCMMLLNRMGPKGQEIYKTFTFEDSREREDINKLLKKFDFYLIFGNLKREDADETDKYVNALTVMALRHITDVDKIVKEKMLMEIDKDKFTRKVENLIPGFSYPSGIQWLTVKEILYIWMSYENFDFKRDEKILGSQVKNCRDCGDTHALNRCRAHGKKCDKCGIENHFFYRCPTQYFANCKRCGEGHFSRQCPAYGNECHKCQKPNHFSWKCGFQKLLECKFCGYMHYASNPCVIRKY